MYILRKTDDDIHFTKGNIYECRIYDNGMIFSTSDNTDEVDCKIVEDFKDLKNFDKNYQILNIEEDKLLCNENYDYRKYIVRAYGYLIKARKHNIKGNDELVYKCINNAMKELREIYREDVSFEDDVLKGFREWFLNKG